MAKLGSLNLATLGDAERQAVSADRAACLIRWEVRNLKGQDRQRVAKLLLDKHPVEMRELISESLRRRASGSR